MVTWHQARDTCINAGGRLVEICDAETMQMLEGLIEAEGMLIMQCCKKKQQLSKKQIPSGNV